MHIKLRKAAGLMALPLLASSLAVGAAALPAHAATWQDTALSARAMHTDTFAGANLKATDGVRVINLSGTGVAWSLHGKVPLGVKLFSTKTGAMIGYLGRAITHPVLIVVNATDPAGNAQALEIPVTIGHNSIKTSGPAVTVSLSGLAATNIAGNVKFSAVSSLIPNSISFAEFNLPAGLVSGDPVLTYVGGTAAPGTYGGVKVTATSSDGAVLNGVFSLVVHAQRVYTPGIWGNMVNPFGNGFDVYKQHQYAGAIVVGWTATKADPATHFLCLKGTHPGALRFEYAPNGAGTGLFVSDPGGGWASDPLPDGLILTNSNSGPFQQFIPLPNGTLKNLATGLIINPAGTGVQLRGGAAPTPWGGSVYTWTDYAHLPR